MRVSARPSVAAVVIVGVLTATFGLVAGTGASARQASGPAVSHVVAGHDSKHDTSQPLRTMRGVVSRTAGPSIAASTLSFDGTSIANSACPCAPPDMSGEAGATQYVQVVNTALQVFKKSTGASVLGPTSLANLWGGFGGVCEHDVNGSPILLYDQFAKRWVVSHSAGFVTNGKVTDECIAVSATADATGSWHRYDFHLGSNFYAEPMLAVWRDGYYMSANVYPSMLTALGPQPFAFDRAHMLSGAGATFVSPTGPLGANADPMLPADIDGSTLPAAGAPESFVTLPGDGAYTTFHFHADFAVPADSTWTTFASPAAQPFTDPCGAQSACVPQLGSPDNLDARIDRLMFRLTYRIVGGHEAVVGNFTVKSSAGVAAIRWFELRNVTHGPESVFQEGTYEPDTTWRWNASAATDRNGDIALGFSASSAVIHPQIRYAGRLASDPLNTMARGEAHLFDGTGSQTDTGHRWGDNSDLTIDPVDDCTFWYTNEYYKAGMPTSFNWRTRIGKFRFPSCGQLHLGKFADASNATYGSPIGYTVALTNGAAQTATGLAVNDPLPPGTGLHWSVDSAHSDPGWSVTGSPPNQRLVYTPTTLAVGVTTRAHVVSNTGVSSCKTYANTASYTSAELGSGKMSASEVVSPVTKLAYTQNFDQRAAPVLPVDWTATQGVNPAGAPPWETSSTGSPVPVADTLRNSLFSPDPANVLDNRIDSPPIAITATGEQLTFRNNYDLQKGFDGGVLVVSTDGGPFTDIISAGATFASGGYNGKIATGHGSPIAGRAAWTGSSRGFITTKVNLPSKMVGHSIRLRWREGSDNSTAGAGWRVDTIRLNTGTTCGPAADMAIGELAAPTDVARGAQLTYTASVANLGPVTGTGVEAQIMLPPSVTLVSAAATTGTCSGTTVVACSLGSILMGGTAKITITVTPMSSGPITSSASVTTTVTDPDPLNNSAQASATVH